MRKLLPSREMNYSNRLEKAPAEDNRIFPGIGIVIFSQISLFEPGLFIQALGAGIRFPHFEKNSASLLRAGFGNKRGQQHRSGTAAAERFSYHKIFQLPFQVNSPRHEECKNFRSLPGKLCGAPSLIFNHPSLSINGW